MATEVDKFRKEAKKFPWKDRLLHEKWEVRKDANIDLASLCDGIMNPKDSRLKEFAPLFSKTVADSNAAVQEKALDALIAFLKAADSDMSRYAEEVCDSLATKCLTGTPETVKRAQQAFLLWIELKAVEVFLETMEKTLKAKVAKAVVPAIDVLCQAFCEFGKEVVDPIKIIKMVSELYDPKDQNLMASLQRLNVELFRSPVEPTRKIRMSTSNSTIQAPLEIDEYDPDDLEGLVSQDKKKLEGYYNQLQQMRNQELDNDDYGCSSLQETCDQLREEHATLDEKILTTKENIKLAQTSRVEKASELKNFIETKKSTEERKKRLRLCISEEEDIRKERLNTILDLKGSIRVFCRVRPLLVGEKSVEIDYPNDAEFAGREINFNINDKKQNYTFDKVFSDGSTQKDLFDEVSQLVQSSLDGQTVSIFAYGQTGSGKTHTMMGKTNSEDAKGIIPRSLEMIFHNLKSKGPEYHAKVSVLEVYDKKINDLLLEARDMKKSREAMQSNVKVQQVASNAGGQGGDVTKEVFTVTGLTTKKVFTAKDASEVLSKAAQNRSTWGTKMNKESSRGHMIFSLAICSTDEATEKAHGALNLIDLAGNERLKESQPTGDRKKETEFINSSLSELGQVIRGMIRGNVATYRNSKLTEVLQPCLRGDPKEIKILMIVNVSPATSSWAVSHTSLDFAKDIYDARFR